MDRITAIEKSLTAFVCGLIGLIPILGLPLALYAGRCSLQVRGRYRDPWNPAAAYLSWGARLAFLGLLGSLLVVCLAVLIFICHEFDWMR
jgi:hypothetical protein